MLEVEMYYLKEKAPEGFKDYFRWSDHRALMVVTHNQEVICKHADGGEPEDNSFARDWNFVPGIIKKAYELGVKDGKEELLKGKEELPKGKEEIKGKEESGVVK